MTTLYIIYDILYNIIMSPENKINNFGVYAVCSVVAGRDVIQTECSFHDFNVINNALLCAHTTTIQIIHVYLMCIQNLFIIYMMDIIIYIYA